MREPRLPVVAMLLLPAAALAAPGDAVLPARDLLHGGASVSTPAEPVRGRLSDAEGGGAIHAIHRIVGEGVLETSESGEPVFVVPDDRGERMPALAPEELEAVLRSFSGYDGPGLSIHPDSGVVRAPAAAAAGIAAALARVRARRPGPVDLEIVLDSPVAGAPVPLLAARGPVVPGETAIFADARERRLVGDYSVEIAQASSISDPILFRQRLGRSVTIRVRPLPRGEAAVVEVVVRSAVEVPAEPIRTGHGGFGPIDRAAAVIDEAGLAFRVDRGKTAEVSWTGHEGRPLRLRVTARWEAPPADAAADPILWSRLLGTVGVTGFFNARAAQPPHEEKDHMPAVVRDLRPETLIAAWSPEPDLACEMATERGLVLLAGAGQKAKAGLADAILAGLDAETRSARFEVVALDVPAGAEIGRDGRLPEGAREMARFSGPVILGLPACFNGGFEERYLHDWDVEVAQGSRIPDPIISSVEDGHYLDIRVDEDADGRPASVDLRFEVLRLERIETERVPLDVPLPAAAVVVESGKGNSAKGDETSATPALPQDMVTIEKPVVKSLRIAVAGAVGADGSLVVRRACPGFLGAGREALVVVRVR